MNLTAVDWPLVAEHLGRMALAFALALPLGWERGRGRHTAGFRTMPVVAMASCGYALLALRLPDADAQSLTRLLQGVLAGIGFIGGGAILKERGHVRGLVTAATIWNTGAVGLSVAFGRVEVALALSIANLLVLVALTPLREPPGPDNKSDAAP
jgi:putative Mg2+ transporter-C (MgtC) family protein